MSNFLDICKKETLTLGQYKSYLFLVIGIVLQVIVSIWSNADAVSLISAVAGIISVVLCSQKKMLFYLFGFIQMFTYCYLAYEQRLYGELGENAFYFITMIIGIVLWKHNYNTDKAEVQPCELSAYALSSLFASMALLCWAFFSCLSNYTNDTQPLLDSITTIPAIYAQILLMLRYREQWLFWLIIDIGSIVMWFNAGNMCMVAQFVIWTLNCIYGLYKWK